MQFFYIDESEGGGRSELDDLYIIGAVSLDERQLVAAEAGVRSLDEDVFGTRQANQIREFHGHELYSGKGLFRQIPPADRIKICHRLIDIVEKNDLSIGYVCINKRKSIANKHPDQLAFLLLLERVEDLMKTISQTALIVADENDKIEQRLVDDLEFSRTKASIRRRSLPMASPLTAARLESSVARIATNEVECAQIIALRIHTWSFEDESESSRSSSPKAQPRGSSPLTPPSTTTSVRNAT